MKTLHLDPAKIALTVPESAFAVGVSARTINEWIRRGDLKSLKLGGRRLIRRSDLQDFIDAAAAAGCAHAA
jgi:excisionase family DNA binding protein